jgi:phage terminase small subunit
MRAASPYNESDGMLEARTASDRALELVELAGRLRLTRLQTDFVLALVADPKRNQTKAAIEAGASSKTAHIWASKKLRLAKVQEFLAKVTEAAAERARERALASPAVRQVENAIMESAEYQLRLSRLGRADIGKHLEIDAEGVPKVRVDPAHTGFIREVRVEEFVGSDGQIKTTTTLKVADSLPALVALGRVRGWEKPESQPADTGLALQILGAVTVKAFKDAYLKLVAAGNGNGTGSR